MAEATWVRMVLVSDFLKIMMVIRCHKCHVSHTCVALSLRPLDVQRKQLHLGPVEALEVRLDRALAHQLVNGHDAEDRGLPHTALNIVISLIIS